MGVMPPLASHKFYSLQRLLKATCALAAARRMHAARRLFCCALILRRVWTLRAHCARNRYVACDVRDRGIWRDWRRAGLQHVSDAAMIRFCGLPMRLCYDLARALIPIFPRLRPHSAESPNPIWLGANPPVCDLLDIVVLKLREIATVGYQHQLESDMGVPRGSLWKYLKMGKYGLSCVFRSLDASRIGLHEHVEEARACMSALERQFGPCPLAGNVFAYFLDGTVQRIRRPPLGPERDSWWSGNKKCYACNTVLLVSPFGLIHWYNAGLPGCINDMRASIEIFDALQDPEYNPFKAGTIVDYLQRFARTLLNTQL